MQQLNSYERKPTVDSSNVDISNAVQGVNHGLSQGGQDTPLERDRKGIEIDTDLVVSTDQLDRERFMQDVLEIHLAEPASESDAGFAEVTVNGKYMLFVRGNTHQAPRTHVAVLAQAKAMRITQKKVVNADGSMGYEERAQLHLMYPFQVLHDPNPRLGSPWLKKLLQNPA
jgi:hypothetical protein